MLNPPTGVYTRIFMQQPLESTSPDMDIACERISAEVSERTGTLNLKNLRLRELPEELTGLKHLEILDCSVTFVSDLSPLAKLGSLLKLICSNTDVHDLSPLAGQFITNTGLL